ncbi:TVP38/TMEM64 family protein [Corallococcus exercitus]|uniref:TVP38/TMEM64 family protein n=1 Tax=Corallococcus exercitus TaxID=2316736 RepID=UPI000EA2E7C6|nr:VTT domain-containing protein [Corallococcus exercitus]RKG72457.1 TVP38/TMEM64 family protein [Corallococcus exercitus]
MTPRMARYARLGAVALVFVMFGLAWHLGIFTQAADPKTLARTLVAMGAWGYLAFVVAYTVLQPFGVPGTVFIVAAPLIWPWQTAFVLSMVGTMSASVVGFSFARFVAKDWVSARIPARLRKYDDALERNAFQTVFLLRLLLWMPQVLHSFLGVSKVGFWTHFWGSLLGYVPPLLFVSYLGGEMFDASGKMLPAAWPILAGLLIASLLVVVLVRVRERCRQAGQAPRCGAASPWMHPREGSTSPRETP